MQQEEFNYQRIEKAIAFIQAHFREQPSLDEIAHAVDLSPFHFQRMFTEWAGVSPKKFLQYMSVAYAKDLLQHQQATLFETSIHVGLSGPSRLHDLFVNIEAMTPANFKQGGADLSIGFGFTSSPFGEVIMAATNRGICHLAFVDDQEEAIATLKTRFPNAHFQQRRDAYQQQVVDFFKGDQLAKIKLHLKGTDFQLKVWEALLGIPAGNLVTYQTIASRIDRPLANRAVGSAIGQNPVAFLIPCHRVIQSTGNFGQYHWGSTRKAAIIGWEAAKVNGSSN